MPLEDSLIPRLDAMSDDDLHQSMKKFLLGKEGAFPFNFLSPWFFSRDFSNNDPQHLNCFIPGHEESNDDYHRFFPRILGAIIFCLQDARQPANRNPWKEKTSYGLVLDNTFFDALFSFIETAGPHMTPEQRQTIAPHVVHFLSVEEVYECGIPADAIKWVFRALREIQYKPTPDATVEQTQDFYRSKRQELQEAGLLQAGDDLDDVIDYTIRDVLAKAGIPAKVH